MTPELVKTYEGKEFSKSRWFEIDQTRIDAFADVTEDWQFIHVDPEESANGPFGATIAHGFLTLSMLTAMAYDALPHVNGAAMGVNYGFNRLRFITPVLVNSRLRGRFTLLTCDLSVPDEMTCTWSIIVELEGADKPALAAEWINRWYLEDV